MKCWSGWSVWRPFAIIKNLKPYFFMFIHFGIRFVWCCMFQFLLSGALPLFLNVFHIFALLFARCYCANGLWLEIIDRCSASIFIWCNRFHWRNEKKRNKTSLICLDVRMFVVLFSRRIRTNPFRSFCFVVIYLFFRSIFG